MLIEPVKATKELREMPPKRLTNIVCRLHSTILWSYVVKQHKPQKIVIPG